MNKQDLFLIIIVAIIGLSIYLGTILFNNDTAKVAKVYYDNKLVLTIDLSIDELKEYQVDGYNDKVVIEAKKNQIRVKEEDSPLHICSKQGWVNSTYEPIICLPNKVTIKIESTNEELDAVVR